MGTGDFAAIAEACARGRDDLRAQGHAPDGRKTLRRFSTWEITRYLIPVAQAHFRRVLRAHPDLPQGRSETEAGAKWFTLDEVLRLRAHFAAEGSRAKEYAPWRPEGLPAKICAIANFKGGVGKTSTAAHLAMSAALDGYRVLVIDLDSQGSMTSVFGGQVADEWDTVFPLIARDYALGLRAENRRRVERDEPPSSLDETLEAALEKTAADVIQPTHWPNIDLIGAQLNLYWAEFQIPVWRTRLRGWKLWDALSDALAARRRARPLRRGLPRYPPRPRLSHHQRARRRRHPAGAARRVVSRIQLHGPVLRHARIRPSARSRRARTSPPAPSAAPRPASSGMRCARSSPAMTASSRRNWPR